MHEPLIGGMDEALARAYQYLRERARTLGTPSPSAPGVSLSKPTAPQGANDAMAARGRAAMPRSESAFPSQRGALPAESLSKTLEAPESRLGEFDATGEGSAGPGGLADLKYAPGFLGQLFGRGGPASIWGQNAEYMPPAGALSTAVGSTPDRPHTAGPIGPNIMSPQDVARGKPRIQNGDGSVSTESTIGIEADGKHYLIPTIVNGKRVSADEAVAAWRAGSNPEVGVFNSRAESDAAGQSRSDAIGRNIPGRRARGALPAPATPVSAPTVGALEAMDNPHTAGPIGPNEPYAEADDTTATAPRASMAEEFRKRKAERGERASNAPTAEQKKQAILEAGLAIMAAASRGGASALGAIGEGGQRGTAAMREFEKVNREEGRDKRREDREDLNLEFNLEKADRDDERADKTLDEGVRHRKAMENFQQQSLEIQRQYKEGLITQKQAQLEIQAARNEAQNQIAIAKLEAAAARAGAAADKTPAEVRLMEYLNTPEKIERYQRIRGEKGGISEKDIIAQAVELTKSQTGLGGNEDPSAVLQRNIEVVRRAAGRGGSAAPATAKPASEAEAHGLAKKAVEEGRDKNLVNQRLKAWGYKPI